MDDVFSHQLCETIKRVLARVATLTRFGSSPALVSLACLHIILLMAESKVREGEKKKREQRGFHNNSESNTYESIMHPY